MKIARLISTKAFSNGASPIVFYFSRIPHWWVLATVTRGRIVSIRQRSLQNGKANAATIKDEDVIPSPLHTHSIICLSIKMQFYFSVIVPISSFSVLAAPTPALGDVSLSSAISDIVSSSISGDLAGIGRGVQRTVASSVPNKGLADSINTIIDGSFNIPTSGNVAGGVDQILAGSKSFLDRVKRS